MDWVVLTAAIVGLGIGAVGYVRGGVNDLGDDIEASLANASVAGILPEGYNYISQQYRDFAEDLNARRTDEEILSTYEFRVRHLQRIMANGIDLDGPDYDGFMGGLGPGQAMDMIRLLANEMNERGLSVPEGSPTVDELIADIENRYGTYDRS